MDAETRELVNEMLAVAADLRYLSCADHTDLADRLRAAADCLMATREEPGYAALLLVFHEAQEMMRYRVETPTGNSQEVATTHVNHLIRAVRAAETEQAHPALTVTSVGPGYGALRELLRDAQELWSLGLAVGDQCPPQETTNWDEDCRERRDAADAIIQRLTAARAALAAAEG